MPSIETEHIPEQVFAHSESGGLESMDDLLSLVNIYYWYTDAWWQPEDYLSDVLIDLSDIELEHAMGVLEDFSASQVDLRPDKPPFDSFDEFWAAYGARVPTPDRREAMARWCNNLVDPDVIRYAYNNYLARTLAENGASDIEIGNAGEVLQLEAQRRALQDDYYRWDYAKFRSDGGSYEDFVGTVLLNRIALDDFQLVMDNYEDLPEDAADWPVDKKRALTKRFLDQYADYCGLFEVNYQYLEEGFRPPYINRFLPESDDSW